MTKTGKPRVGIYGSPFDIIGGGQVHQLMVAQSLTDDCDVELIHHVPNLSHDRLLQEYGLDLTEVKLRCVAPFRDKWPFAGPESRRSAFGVHRALTRDYDVFVDSVHGPPLLCEARTGVIICLFPSLAREEVWPWNESNGATPLVKRVVRNAVYRRRWERVWSGYRHCITISNFAARWVKSRWNLDAEVIYPGVRARYEERPKAPIILSVGRMTRKGVPKRQLEMVRAFGQLHALLPPEWEYWCIGGLGEDPDDAEYVAQIKAAAQGLPIRVLTNPDDMVVKDAYERAAIFWHAAGFGEDETIHPERAEHFGLSTVEAMAAGCAPVVIRMGAQPEIVEEGSSGFLWSTLEELTARSLELVRDPELRSRIGAGAVARSRRFTDLERFEALTRRAILST